jgi:transaldolase
MAGSSVASQSYKSPLHKMTQTTQTCLWNDSASRSELAYSIDNGGVGATCNPVIVVDVLKSEWNEWRGRIRELIAASPMATEDELSWKLVEEISAGAARLLEPIFAAHKGKNGRLSLQTDPRLYRDSKRMLSQAIHFSKLAPNLIVKIAATKAGIAAMEEATYQGVSVNATVCFTLPQCLAVAEAIERGLKRREKEGKDVSSMGPVCTIMVGRLDDWLKVVQGKAATKVNADFLEWAGIAVFKKTYKIFRERGYRARLLSAAFRNDMHWSELIGGDVVISPPHKWQVRFNASNIEVVPRIENPVDPTIVKALLDNFADFRRAYTEDGLTPDGFDTFPATRRTLRQFITACHELNGQIREVMIPNPDDEPLTT